MKKITAIVLCLAMALASASVAFADEAGMALTKSSDEVKMGETIDITVSASGVEPIKSGGLAFSFDQDVFEVVSGKWLVDSPILQDFDEENLRAAFAYGPDDAHNINGDIFLLTLRAKTDTTTAGASTITIEPTLKDNDDIIVIGPEKGLTTTVTIQCNKHNYGTLIPEVPATCEQAGKAAYYQCSACKKLFDKNKKEVTEDSLVIPALDHKPGNEWQSDDTNHWKVCVNDGCGKIIESTKAPHEFTWKIDKPATEDEVGYQHEECDCGFTRSENTEIPVLDHVHKDVTFHPEVKATCHSTGTAGYWTCSSPKCAGNHYADEACSIILDSLSLPVDPTNHDGGEDVREAVEATCVKEGYSGDKYCLGCGAMIEKGKILPATGIHTDADGKWDSNADSHWHVCECGEIFDKEVHKGGEATCVSKAACSACGTEYGAINSDNHKHTEIRDSIAATVDKEGYSGDVWCKDCGLKIADGKTIPKLTESNSAGMEDPQGQGAETSDDMNLTALLAIMAASMGAVAVLTVTRWKKN